ncbi:site-specific DNA-methyltransferase [Mesorhizobium sp. B2-2-4]|uniref:DNA-methyltransferase n=1 Tax=unclassified Mesorhizobium TaxID=325217 RepID=UPI00112DB360|nr:MULTISPECIES: site-specific DNA-methyltransferase [unclassified Mesorhizobium]TPM58998.1 site-specific DNA-methyltransferase [Mesorhizobium sp. B2-2-4]TPM67483.1 site-specific DNA-methyltransferase [Mesorhizobium sp. B2-2-1]
MGEFTKTDHLDSKVTLYGGDNRDVLKSLPDNSISAIVTDPPYALVSIQKRFGGPNASPAKDGDVYSRASAGFMGKNWDTGEVAFSEVFWAECLRVLKPGGHVVAFSGTRTYHRMAVAIEDAGFEIRDQLAWAYGSGFPKSHDVSKAIDKDAGAVREVVRERYTTKRLKPGATVEKEGEWGKQDVAYTATDTAPATDAAREWQGWGTALKPAWEPICLARKPLAGTVAANVLEHGTGALNIDATRVGTEGGTAFGRVGGYLTAKAGAPIDAGRWPANIVHDGSDEVVSCFPDTASGGAPTAGDRNGVTYGEFGERSLTNHGANSGSAARFFYTAKADKLDRIGSKHPTVKPVDLMQWLVRLVTPKGGLVLDPFAGSGSTGEAAWREGMRCILIEREEEYQADIAERLRLADKGPTTRKARAVKQVANDNLPLFGGTAAGGGAR